jgi:RNA polymerase sigma-70 factor (ECF subfamily)
MQTNLEPTDEYIRAAIDRMEPQVNRRLRVRRTKTIVVSAATVLVAGGNRPHRGLKRAGWISGTTIVVAGIAAALVLSNVVGVAGWRGGAEPAAAAALSDAAAATIKTSDPVVGPGQYLKVSTQAVYSVDGDDGTGHGAAYLATQDGQMYVPADHNDDWVWVRDPSTVAQTFGPASKRAAAADNTSTKPEIIRAAKGAWYNGKPTAEGFDSLPRDPQQLLNYIYRVTAGAGVSRDGEALVYIADTLRTGVVPADLRAALYKAVAGIPGVTITDKAATLDGRTGIAFGRDEGNGVRQEIIIDPGTGLLIGEREVLLRNGILPGVPAGESMGWTAVTTTVVDSAPAGGSICGPGSHPIGGAGSAQCKDN